MVQLPCSDPSPGPGQDTAIQPPLTCLQDLDTPAVSAHLLNKTTAGSGRSQSSNKGSVTCFAAQGGNSTSAWTRCMTNSCYYSPMTLESHILTCLGRAELSRAGAHAE